MLSHTVSSDTTCFVILCYAVAYHSCFHNSFSFGEFSKILTVLESSLTKTVLPSQPTSLLPNLNSDMQTDPMISGNVVPGTSVLPEFSWICGPVCDLSMFHTGIGRNTARHNWKCSLNRCIMNKLTNSMLRYM